jgi:pyruvate dehydrogenase E2 component (dihydrolipoamide acetyltransferase)
MVPVIMPVVGQDIPTGIIREWLKSEGEAVSKEEIIATVESEKATFDVEAPADGILLKILRKEEEEVEVLTPIAYIGEKGETPEPGEKEAEGRLVAGEEIIETKTDHTDVSVPAASSRIFVSPLAKKIAEKEGIRLESVTGTGPNGRIIRRNILEAIKQPVPEIMDYQEDVPDAGRRPEMRQTLPEGAEEILYNRMRRLIADKLTLSKQTVPHFYLFTDVEMDRAIVFKDQLMQGSGVRVTITDMVVYAVAGAMGEYPRMNSHVFNDRYFLLRDINIGLAVSSDDGLRVPVIEHADKGDLTTLAARTKQLSENARKGRIDPGLKAGLTVSTLGMYGIKQFLPIINPPESAILAVGKSTPRVTTDGFSIAIRNIMSITLACDHRLIDGAYGAGFLGRVKEILEQAEFKKMYR